MSDAGTPPAPSASSRAVTLAVVVAALGYMVDIYDLVLFSVVRLPSLREIGVPEAQLGTAGLAPLEFQMTGMLLGGLLWGILGDKRGRLSVLFGSILMYSLANIANGFVTDLESYKWIRFVAGIGLAGELGAGVTLVSELVDRHRRGWATTIIAGVGICGALLAATVGKTMSWRVAYFVGGGLGLALLLLRIGVLESGMFARVKSESAISRGNFLALFANRRRAIKYVSIILCGVPIWYAIGILVTLSKEIGTAMGMPAPPDPAWAVFWSYAGLAVGDFGSGALSQIVKSRRRALVVFVLLACATVAVYFSFGRTSLVAFYVSCGLLGVANGYWAVFITVASEQFGTNLRATATTTAPNFVRGAVVPLTASYKALLPAMGPVGSAAVVGAVTLAIALASVLGLEETYGKDLDFVEK